MKPLDHMNLAFDGVINAAINWRLAPKTPLYAAPPRITAKDAALATRRATAAGVTVEEPA